MINIDSRRAANDADLDALTDFQSRAPTIPHTTLKRSEIADLAGLNDQRRMIATLTHQRDEAQRETAIFRRRCVEQARALGDLLGKRALHPISAATIWSEIVAKADLEGAMHRDDVLAILRKHGAV